MYTVLRRYNVPTSACVLYYVVTKVPTCVLYYVVTKVPTCVLYYVETGVGTRHAKNQKIKISKIRLLEDLRIDT